MSWSWDKATAEFSKEDENAPSFFDQAGAIISSTVDWVSDTAAPAVGTAFTIVTNPHSAEAINFYHHTHQLGTYAYENPERATALGVQGGWNGVTSLTGFAADLGRGAVNFVVTEMSIVSAYNAGMEFYAAGLETPEDAEEAKSYIVTSPLGDDAFFAISESWGAKDSEFGAIQNWDWLNLSEEQKEYFQPYIDNYIKDENGALIENPNALYERILLYGPQAISETIVFAGISAFTGGVGGAALGAMRAGKIGQYSSKVVRAADEIGDVAKDIKKIEKQLSKIEDAGSAKAAKLSDELQELKDKKAALEEASPSAADYRSVQQLDKEAQKIRKDIDARAKELVKLKNSGASDEALEQAQEKITALSQSLSEKTAQIGTLTEKAMQAGEIATSSAERALNAGQTYTQKGADFGNVLKDGKIGKSIEGAMIPTSMALSIEQDQEEAKQEEKASTQMQSKAFDDHFNDLAKSPEITKRALDSYYQSKEENAPQQEELPPKAEEDNLFKYLNESNPEPHEKDNKDNTTSNNFNGQANVTHPIVQNIIDTAVQNGIQDARIKPDPIYNNANTLEA